MELPELFKERMKAQLGAEYQAFLASYDDGPFKGLRVNTLKISAEEFAGLCPWSLTPVPWCGSGFYFGGDDRPGLSAYHEAGLCYIQEPSAMAVAEMAAGTFSRVYGTSVAGARALDLCAAPGGKSTQLAAAMEGKGVLLANEIHPSRARVLSSNIERMGMADAVVTNETPQRLSKRFASFFDLVLADAPCSGEGMFRKDPCAADEWSPENVAMCASRQKEILNEAAEMVSPGGFLVYSTCTFSTEENEENIEWFLKTHEDFSLLEMRRLMPHLVEGEGHFAAVMQRRGERRTGDEAYGRSAAKAGAGGFKGAKGRHGRGGCREALKEAEALFRDFEDSALTRGFRPGDKAGASIPLMFGENLYLCPGGIDIEALRVLRPGLHLGTVKKGRFEPSHALSHVLSGADARRVAEVGGEGDAAARYLRGESLPYEGQDGWVLVTSGGFGLGWGKAAGGVLKNHYPKGLRRR